MNKNKGLLNLMLILPILALLSGCVVGRRTVDLTVPNPAMTSLNKGEVYIAGIEDHRIFQNKPPLPSIPSIDGDVGQMSTSEQSLMIGRQRNGYGMAMGDIALPEGESVEVKMRKLIESGLSSKGYTISGQPDSGYDFDAEIIAFWAWFTPGMFAVSFEAEVVCDIKIHGQGADKEMRVKGYGKNTGQIASDANWQLAYTRAFNDFLLNFRSKLDENGL